MTTGRSRTRPASANASRVCPEVVAAAIGDELCERRVADVAEKAIEHPVGPALAVGDERLAESARREAEQPLVRDVRQRVEPRAEPRPAGLREELLKLAAPRELDDVPAARFEHRAH